MTQKTRLSTLKELCTYMTDELRYREAADITHDQTRLRLYINALQSTIDEMERMEDDGK